ncbi:hypothetical protein TrCOL_g9374 [Triparma columacea]|uniref:Tryptophan synthase beta chain-like PALP domain-containing protein n=1 Tax=Triparma columacea TaxID=722753 RepID=A0A9W7FXK3_9STRA|nr:hypothetical protein TrCOL_g9374 [Triparma columacea]
MSNELTLSIYSQRRKQRLLSRFNSSNYIKSIGNTPLERWSSISDAVAIISPSEKPSGGVWLKREDKNPGGTAKDRVAKSVLLGWLTRGLSVSGVVEGSSGSTGIAWASICKEVGLPFRCYVPDDQSESKFRKIRELGGSVVVVKTASISSGEHYVNRARNDAREREGWRFGDQFEEPGNYLAHSTGTGPEILSSMSGLVDLFCMSAGTGGMLSGVGNLILNLGGRVVAADVTGSVYGNWVEGGVAYCEQQRERGVRKHRYDTIAEGIGMDRITGNLGRLKGGVEGVRVEEQDIVDAAWWIFRKEGIRVGSSTAVNIMGVLLTGRGGERIVTVMCSSGEREKARLWDRRFVEGRGLEWREGWREEEWRKWIEGIKERRKGRKGGGQAKD